MLTVYKVKGKAIGLEFLFKYHLNGSLNAFEIVNGELSDDQIKWLFDYSRFPSREAYMLEWTRKPEFKKLFDVVKVPADLSFDTLWSLYNYKVAKADAERSFKKLNEPDIIKCFLGLKPYEDYLARTKIAKAHLSRYINAKYYENEY